MRRRRLMTIEDATPATKQHAKPCGDCPWRKDAIQGWLGSMTADEWLRAAHGEALIDCHTKIGAQCAGSAIYRANVFKVPRDPDTLRLPADTERVFTSPGAFTYHHEKSRR